MDKDFVARFSGTILNPIYLMSDKMGQNTTNLSQINLMRPSSTDYM